MRATNEQQSAIMMELAINLADFMNAVNLLPKGILWSQTFSQSKAGFYGVVASGLGFYKLYKATM